MTKTKKFGLMMLGKTSVFLTTAFFTYHYHVDLKKVDFNIFEKKNVVAENYFVNPAILDVKWQGNDRGELETYLVNNETNKRISIYSDMLPSNEEMLSGIKNRLYIKSLDRSEIERIVNECDNIISYVSKSGGGFYE